MDALGRGMIYISGRVQWDDVRYYHHTQNGVQFKFINCFFVVVGFFPTRKLLFNILVAQG